MDDSVVKLTFEKISNTLLAVNLQYTELSVLQLCNPYYQMNAKTVGFLMYSPLMYANIFELTICKIFIYLSATSVRGHMLHMASYIVGKSR